MMFLFEDSVTSPMSSLLRYVLKSQRVEFAGSNGELQKVAERLLTKKLRPDENLFIFVDVVPDNKALPILFSRLRHEFASYPNVFVVPWFGAEYHMLRLLNRTFNDSTLTDVMRGLKTTKYAKVQKKNLEKVSKYILEDITKQIMGCTLNRADTSGVKETNLFYTSDCSCESCPLNNQGKRREQKACELYAVLFMKVFSESEFPDYLSEIYSWNVTTYADALDSFTKVYNSIKGNLRNQGKQVFDLEA